MLLTKKILHLWQTTILINVNITIPIKYALTGSTETSTKKCRLSKANQCDLCLNFDPISITLAQICKQYGVKFGGIKLDSMF